MSRYLTDLAAACRKSGLEVIEVAGWRTRGHGQMQAVDSIMCHHTATPATAKGDYPSLGVVRDGHATIRGPLAQIGLGRSGTVYVIAAGLCWHAGRVHLPWQANPRSLGIEAEHPGRGRWPAEQYAAYVRLVAALSDHYGARVIGHKEAAKPTGRKIDPTFDMDAFRADVATLHTQEDQMNPSQEAKLDLTIAKVDAGRSEAQQIRLEQKIQSDRSSARDAVMLAAIEALSATKGVDPAPIIAAVEAALAQVEITFTANTSKEN